MVRCFALQQDESVESFDSLADVRAAIERRPTEVWIDLEAPDKKTIDTVGTVLGLDEEALDDCISGEQRPRIDEFDHCLFLVAYGAVGPESRDTFDPRKIAAFIGRGFLVTIHHNPLRSVNNALERCSKTPKRTLSRGTDFILYAIIDGMVDNYIHVAEVFNDRLDVLEEECFSPDVDQSILQRASRLRREVLELRRIAASQREILLPIARGEYSLVSESLENDFRHVVDHLTKTIELIDNLRELLHGVRDNYQAVLGNRMNAIMKTLTMFASLFLPLSLLAGIYGMNTPLWPDPTNALTFWGIIVTMSAAIVGMLGYFRHRNWL